MEDESRHFIGKVSQKIILQCDNKILICRGINDTLWEFPGGRLHVEQTPQENLIREIQEELGITIQSPKPLHIGMSLHLKSNTWRVLIMYHGVVSKFVLTPNPEEVEEARWITLDELRTFPLFDDCREAGGVFLEQHNQRL